MRLVPVGEVFTRMQFVVHDLAHGTHKKVELRASGQETEVDKLVVERMIDPLLHLVRNAAAHGIETPEQRIKKGKPEAGTLSLRAAAEGDMVVIEVEDDGAGIDVALVQRRAREIGLVAPARWRQRRRGRISVAGYPVHAGLLDPTRV